MEYGVCILLCVAPVWVSAEWEGERDENRPESSKHEPHQQTGKQASSNREEDWTLDRRDERGAPTTTHHSDRETTGRYLAHEIAPARYIYEHL